MTLKFKSFEDVEEAVLVEAAYLRLLRVRHDSVGRAKNQAAYAAIRDWISDLTGRTAEEVQNEFEAAAERFRDQS